MAANQTNTSKLDEEIDPALRDLASNLIAVTEGRGRPALIADQIRHAADLLRDFRALEAEDPDPEKLVVGLRQLRRAPTGSTT
jgi:hypothetical protein